MSAWGANKLVGTAAGHALSGGATNDTLQDLGFRSALAGGAGHDTYYVINVDSAVVEKTGDGNDTVYAYRDYRLTANVENLVMAGNDFSGVGNGLDNLLISTGWRNLLEGGQGNDVLSDQSASTTRFQFNAGDGSDVVYGFAAKGAGADLIKLTGYGYSTFAEIKSHMTQAGSDVLIKHDNGDQVLIKDMVVANLSASNFMLPVDLSNYHLSFAEEFNTLSLVNPATGLGTWKTQFATGSQNSIWTGYSSRTLAPNNELQLYVDPFLTGTGAGALGLNPFQVENGVVTIHADRTPAALDAALWGYDYTSGLLTTQTSFAQTYGYFEIRAELPTGQGVWPAFWLLPETPSASVSELDVFEQLGGTTLYQTAHSGTKDEKTQTGFSTLVPTATSGFHTYGVLWTAETLTWYIDGVASASMPTPADMHQPMYMLVNLAIGGDWGGNPTDAFNGADLRVDYVRAYALDDVKRPVSFSAGVTTSMVDDDLNLTLTGAAKIDGTGNALDNQITGNASANILDGRAGNDTLIGGAGSDTLYGGDGNDVLDGGADRDTLDGGAGDDRIVFDVLDASVNGGAGNDTLVLRNWAVVNLANVSTSQVDGKSAFGFENADASGSTDAVKLTGSQFNNVLIGGSGNDALKGGDGDDVLDGGANADNLDGGGGNDRIVYDAADFSVGGGGGSDTLVLLGDAFVNLGNSSTSQIAGKSVFGFENADASGASAAVTLLGSQYNNVLTGGGGDDTLSGRGGRDTLQGGAGADTFVFDVLDSSTNRDVIADFSAGQDRIGLDRSVFTGFADNAIVDAGAFVFGDRARTADQHLIYNQGQGALYYDADGVGGLAQIQIATLSNHAALTAGDFYLM
ncbi:hypothetical protein BZG35_05725 [Brevundimonas sp. LM2]|nr:hypothetical protein BZG35_05725 [Brevundimonas sp. LM2]